MDRAARPLTRPPLTKEGSTSDTLNLRYRLKRAPSSRRGIGSLTRPVEHSIFRAKGTLVVLVVVFFIPVIVAVEFTIPVVVVLDAPPVSLPVAAVEPSAFIARDDPMRSGIWRECPVTSVPSVMVSHRIPVAIDPYITRPGSERNGTNHRRWRRPDIYSNGKLGRRQRRAGQKHCQKRYKEIQSHTYCICTHLAKNPATLTPAPFDICEQLKGTRLVTKTGETGIFPGTKGYFPPSKTGTISKLQVSRLQFRISNGVPLRAWPGSNAFSVCSRS